MNKNILFKKIERTAENVNKIAEEMLVWNKQDGGKSINIMAGLFDRLIILQMILVANGTAMKNTINDLGNEFNLEHIEENVWEFNNKEVIKQLQSEDINTESIENQNLEVFKFSRDGKIEINYKIEEKTFFDIEDSYIFESRDYIHMEIDRFKQSYEEVIIRMEEIRLLINNLKVILNSFGKNNRKDLLKIRKHFTKILGKKIKESGELIKKVEEEIGNLPFMAKGKKKGEYVKRTAEQKEDLKNIEEWQKSIYSGKMFLAASNTNIIKTDMDKVMTQITQEYINYIVLNKTKDAILNGKNHSEATDHSTLNNWDLKNIIFNIEQNKKGDWYRIKEKFTLPKLKGKYDGKKIQQENEDLEQFKKWQEFSRQQKNK